MAVSINRRVVEENKIDFEVFMKKSPPILGGAEELFSWGELAGHAAVDDKFGAGDVFGKVGAEEKAGVCHVFKVGDVTDGGLAAFDHGGGILVHFFPACCFDGAGEDHVATDPKWTEIHCKSTGKGIDAAFGSAIGGAVWNGAQGCIGADEDDASFLLLSHTKCRLTHDGEIPDEVCFKDAGHFFYGNGPKILPCGGVLGIKT